MDMKELVHSKAAIGQDSCEYFSSDNSNGRLYKGLLWKWKNYFSFN
jgi:hypothetical protein